MKIQFNSDKNVSIGEDQIDYFTPLITEKIGRFSEQISRLEIHLSDENASKDALNDKRCMIEARLEGMQPIAVTEQANTPEQAIFGAIDKLKASLKTITGRLNDH